jgi:ureidoglycolate hydrolase
MSIPETLMEVKEFTGIGYSPVVDYGQWRVAVLNFIDEIILERLNTLERHNETDEVFVLLKGKVFLFLGEGNDRAEKIHVTEMQPCKIYNIKKSVWHGCTMSEDASILIIENKNTDKSNTSFYTLSEEQKETIRGSAVRLQGGRP